MRKLEGGEMRRDGGGGVQDRCVVWELLLSIAGKDRTRIGFSRSRATRNHDSHTTHLRSDRCNSLQNRYKPLPIHTHTCITSHVCACSGPPCTWFHIKTPPAQSTHPHPPAAHPLYVPAAHAVAHSSSASPVAPQTYQSCMWPAGRGWQG